MKKIELNFIIQSEPLSDIERNEISEFIRSRKLENRRIQKRIISNQTIK